MAKANRGTLRPKAKKSALNMRHWILYDIVCLNYRFVQSFRSCIDQIWGYRRLNNLIEELRSTPYDRSNSEHEAKLLSLWRGLRPDIALEQRKCKQWKEIGFQGEDPATDFRGMGILGLENLL